MNLLTELLATLPELGRALCVLPRVEFGRRHRGPSVLLRALRRQGQRAPERDEVGRRRLRRAIHWVDAWCRGGGNCYRRALLETALDRSAAAKPLAFGFHAQGQAFSGHAWLDGTEATSETYDFTVRL
jgi:hypothetical protein